MWKIWKLCQERIYAVKGAYLCNRLKSYREADKNLGQMSEVFFCTLPDTNSTSGTAVKFWVIAHKLVIK